MKKYKTTLSAANCEQLVACINHIFSHVQPQTNVVTEMITMAALMEVMMVIRKKELEYKKEYKISFTPTQAMAISYLYLVWLNSQDCSNQFVNRMLQMSNEILQQYQL